MSWPVWVLFAFWLAYGVWRWRDNRGLLVRLQRIPRKVRPIRASLLILGSAVGLMAFLLALTMAKGMSSKSVQPWAWPLIGVAGLLFIHAQSTAGAMLVSLAVTPRTEEPSNSPKES